MLDLIYHPESDAVFTGVFSEADAMNGCNPIAADSLRAGTAITTGIGHSTVRPSMDFETYSEAGYILNHETGSCKGASAAGKGGLPVVGTPVYAEHPSTEVLCLYYDLKDGLGRRGWFPGSPNPEDLLGHIAAGYDIEAHNITFEFWIWNMVCVRRYGWPPLRLTQCYCVMAKARRNSLPGALGKLAPALGTTEKHKDGHNLVRKLTVPSKHTKKRPAFRWTPATAWDDFKALYAYCDGDVLAEDEAAARMPDLTPAERQTWLTDQTINVRGVQVDVPALDAMLDILGQTERKYTLELATITGGAVGSVSETAKMVGFLGDNGVSIPNIQAETVTEFLERDDLPPVCRRVLEIRSVLGSANVKKLRTLKLQVSSDGRLRDQYMYCGADRTGRWSAGGVQLQNITAKGPKSFECEACGEFFGAPLPAGQLNPAGCPICGCFLFHACSDWTVDAVESALRVIALRDLGKLERVWPDPIEVLCGCLRGLFIAALGKELICCDFSAIEAVVAACLSRCQWRIDVFNGAAKIYEESASRSTGVPLQEILDYPKNHNGQSHPHRKKIGKVRELAGAYGGWIGAWKNFGADAFMTEAEIKADVLKWRDESPEIVEMWGGQFKWCGPRKWDYVPSLHGLEGMAILAIRNPGKCYSHIDITYGVWDDVLHCRLPSGRFLKYHQPRLHACEDKLRRGPAVQITFMGYNSDSKRGPIGWLRMETYGGRQFENVCQAVALDIQAAALNRLEARSYPVVMHTHDEGSSERPIGEGSVDEMSAIMCEREDWFSWWPIRAAGWKHKRYQKD